MLCPGRKERASRRTAHFCPVLQFLGFAGSSGPSHVTCLPRQSRVAKLPLSFFQLLRTVKVSSRVSFSSARVTDELKSDLAGERQPESATRRPGVLLPSDIRDSARVSVEGLAERVPAT